MAKSGLRHIDVGNELTKTEWESEESHALVHGTSFPSSPVERQLFYRDDEHKWYIYNAAVWVWLGGGGGAGDMLKSVYDTDDDGVVDNSEKLEGSTKSQVQDHAPKAHATSHQDGGADEISVAGLSGLLADSQTPLPHKSSHEDGGSDQISIAGLAGESAEVASHKAVESAGVHGSASAATANKLVHRDASGRAAIASPSADGDIDNKGARDTAISTHAALTSAIHGLKGEVSFSAYQTSGQTLTKSTNALIEWHAEAWDVGSYFDLTNNRHTPLVAGKYYYVCGVQLRSAEDGADLILMIRKNGALYKMLVRGIPGAASHPLASGGCTVDMNGSTDYVDVVVMHYNSVDKDTWGAELRTWFQGFLLPQT